MKKVLLLLILLSTFAFSQSFEIKTHDLVKEDSLGSEIIFDIKIKNTSNDDLTLFIKRTLNDLPADWSSSLCFTSCFAPFLDSIATTTDFGSAPVAAGDSIEVSVHVFPLQNHGNGKVELLIGNVYNPNDTVSFVFEAKSSETTSINELNEDTPSDYYISQNYPNPFNPSTKINFGLKSEGKVKIEVYNVLGQKVDEIVNEYLAPGSYSADFRAKNLSSGVYFYKMQTNSFVKIKKMILEK